MVKHLSVELENADSGKIRQDGLLEALEILDQRSRDILERRWLSEKKATLHDLAAQYKVSAERIRQIEQEAMAKIRSHLAA